MVLDVVLLEDGTPRIVRILRSLRTDLDDIAVEAFAQWRFARRRRTGGDQGAHERRSEISWLGFAARRSRRSRCISIGVLYEGVGNWRGRRRPVAPDVSAQGRRKLEGVRKSPLSPTDAPNSYEHITSFNNFYKFDSGAGDGPKKLAGRFRPSPWKIGVEGLVAKPASYALEDFIKPHALEERIYRLALRGSLVAGHPLDGFPLADVIKRVEPYVGGPLRRVLDTARRRTVSAAATDVLEWPYLEGLRLDEAMHPLAILAVGLYGEPCRIRTARRSGSSCRGSTASRASSRS